MATITANNIPTDKSIVESYWKTLSSLSDNVKLRLATMLIASVVEKTEEK